MAIGLRPLFGIYLEIVPPFFVGEIPSGFTRRISLVVGGHFKGERLSGKVVTGQDAVIVRPDGAALVDVRCLLETDTGDRIYVTYNGCRTAKPEFAEQLRRAEPLPQGADYLRCAFRFEAAAPGLAWLNDLIAVGEGRKDENGPWYDVFEIT